MQEAKLRIVEYRNDLARTRVSAEHWEMVSTEMAAKGHNKESYEYSLVVKSRLPTCANIIPKDAEFLLKLDGPLSSIPKIRNIVDLADRPRVYTSQDDTGSLVEFVIISGAVKDKISSLFNGVCQTTFIRHSKARKDLSESSLYPKLGVDTTLPQFRVADQSCLLLPGPHQYPVWYFFYGTLTEPDRLVRYLDLSDEPTLIPAFVRGGALQIWEGKYNALVDAEACEQIHGKAYEVQSAEQEDILRYYETDRYEVVRCDIHVKHEIMQGLTFRFITTGHRK